MRNPFEVPYSLLQWLLSSICWVVACLAGFLAVSYGLMWLWRSDSSFFLVLGTAAASCFLMWRYVIRVGWRLWAHNRATAALNIVAGLWLLVLTAAFAVSGFSIAFGTLICLAISNEPANTSGSGWMD